jgi:hypothetical protein
MPAGSQRQLPPVTRGHAPTQVVRGMRLATTGDVVCFSLDGEQLDGDNYLGRFDGN